MTTQPTASSPSRRRRGLVAATRPLRRAVLKARGVRCFYDADEQTGLWGKYLAEELLVIYGEQAAAVVVFISAEYAARDWTRLERRAAPNRAVRERREYVLLSRFDDAPLPGLLPGWWLVHPAGPDQVAALAAAAPAPMVVWLDELQRYLDGEHGLAGAMVRALLSSPHPAVIIGTIWPERYARYTTVPGSGAADPHARERQVLDLADVVCIGAQFSPAEQDRARAAAARDPRLQVALGAEGYGLTQTLAAAPQLVACWDGLGLL